MRYTFAPDEVVLNIVGEQVALGPLRSDMIVAYQQWMNDYRVVRALGLVPQPFSYENEQDFFNNSTAGGDQAVFNIYARLTDAPGGELWWGIGTTGLHDISHLHGTARFGIMIGDVDAWNKGYGTEATRLLAGYGFRYHRLNQIWLGVFASNPGAQRAYEKAGYRVVGRRRECRLVAGKLEDEILMECLARDFMG